MPKKQVTSRFRSTDIFSRRVVITISRTGLLLIAFAVIVGEMKYPLLPITIISAIASVIALVTTVEARHQLRNLRYEIREKEAAQLQDWYVPEDIPDIRKSEDAKALLGEIEDDSDAKATILRIPKRPNAS
jgi:hypothetical protein